MNIKTFLVLAKPAQPGPSFRPHTQEGPALGSIVLNNPFFTMILLRNQPNHTDLTIGKHFLQLLMASLRAKAKA